MALVFDGVEPLMQDHASLVAQSYLIWTSGSGGDVV